jgi:hypothetical protein
MSYLTMTGRVIGVFVKPKGTNRETGEEYGGTHQVQILVNEVLKNGEERASLFTLETDRPDAFKGFSGKVAAVPVSPWVRKGSNSVQFSLPPGQVPTECAA